MCRYFQGLCEGGEGDARVAVRLEARRLAAVLAFLPVAHSQATLHLSRNEALVLHVLLSAGLGDLTFFLATAHTD